MEPPTRGRIIFCDKRTDKDGTRGVIHRRNVATPPALSVRSNPNQSKPHEGKVGDALRTAVDASKAPRGDLPPDIPCKGIFRDNFGALKTDGEERAVAHHDSHVDPLGAPVSMQQQNTNNNTPMELVNERENYNAHLPELSSLPPSAFPPSNHKKLPPFPLDDDKFNTHYTSHNDRKISPVNEPYNTHNALPAAAHKSKTSIHTNSTSSSEHVVGSALSSPPHQSRELVGKITGGFAPTYEDECDEANVSIHSNTDANTEEMQNSIERISPHHQDAKDEGGDKLANYEQYDEFVGSGDSTPEPIVGDPKMLPSGIQLPDGASSSQRCTPVEENRPPRIPVPESVDSADQLSPVCRNLQLPPRYSPANCMASPAFTNRYGLPDDPRHGLLSPAGMFLMSPTSTPMGGIPLSPEHEVFRHLSESPSSNSRQGRRRSTLDLRQWKQGEQLGQGSSAEVFKAMCGGQFLAVKKIRLTMGSTAATTREAENLRAEIELLKRLDHPRIVRYAGCLLEEGEFGPDLLIFLEYMPSGSLSSVLKKFGPYGLPLVKKYTRQILEGLAFLHSKGIVHRDVKGANVLVDHMGEAKLADFGACKQLDALHSTMSGNLVGEVKGSVFWMAPEMVIGTAGRRSDIWSTGCVVIEMLTARPPWTQNREASKWSLPQALQHIVESDEIPPAPPNIDRKCADFLTQCLVREHRKRPYAHKLLAHDFLRTEEKL